MAPVHEEFLRDGHVTVRNIAPRMEVATYKPLIESIVETSKSDSQGRIDDYSNLFTQVTNVWRVNDRARGIVFDKRFAAAAARILGVDSVRLYHDQALFKPAGAGRTPWHQDRYYWPLDTNLTVTMWLPLVDVTDDMGTMFFASGSHLAKDLRIAISDSTDQQLEALIKERGWRVSTGPVRVGDATFHSGGTLHSTGPNRTSITREVLTVIYYAAGTRVAEPANDNQRVDLEAFLPGAKPGDEAKSPLNPVLYP